MDYPFTTPPAPGTTLDVAPGVKWLRMPLPFALDHINLWLVAEHDGYTLVDTGYGDAATRSLWNAHCEATLNRRPILKIIATHYHPDHLGNAAWLSERFGAPIAMTAADIVPVLFRRELDTQQRLFAVGEAIAHLNHLVEAGRLERTTDDAGRVRFTPRRDETQA